MKFSNKLIFNSFTAILIAFLAVSSCRNIKKENPYGIEVTDNIAEYLEQVKQDEQKQFVDLGTYIPGIVLDIRYATANNFTGEKIYESADAFARKPVADALLAVQGELKTMGLGLKVFDAYRPYSATLRFYEVYPDTTFVAAPWRGSVHNTGCAVDVTLVELPSGAEMEMPTPFDDFTEKAAHSFNDLPENILKNRKILRDVMTRHGFSVYEAEWWHYNFKERSDFEIMNLSFAELRHSLRQ
jgi:D-alanyl-D-alanine dipeptidase